VTEEDKKAKENNPDGSFDAYTSQYEMDLSFMKPLLIVCGCLIFMMIAAFFGVKIFRMMMFKKRMRIAQELEDSAKMVPPQNISRPNQ